MPNIPKLRPSDGIAIFYKIFDRLRLSRICSSECFLHVLLPLGGGTSARFQSVHFSRDGVFALTSLLLLICHCIFSLSINEG